MTIQDAITKGFLQLNEDEIEQVLNDLFDSEDPEIRFEQGLELMKTAIPEQFVGPFIDLANIIIEANDELDEGEEDEEDEEGDEHEGHDHQH